MFKFTENLIPYNNLNSSSSSTKAKRGKENTSVFVNSRSSVWTVEGLRAPSEKHHSQQEATGI